MSYSLIEATPSAYTYPLLIKSLLQTSLTSATDQEIVYADRVRYDYRTLRQRVCRLASALTDLGIRPGNTVGVLDWDSHRYLECYFAVPSMGAVLHMVNVRLSPEQILYTINHADDDILLVHADFLPLLESIRDRIERVRAIVLLSDDGRWSATTLELSGEYRGTACGRLTGLRISRLRREHPCHDVLHHGHNGATEGSQFLASATRAAHVGGSSHFRCQSRARTLPSWRRVHADHSDVPRPRMGIPLHRHDARCEAGVSRSLYA